MKSVRLIKTMVGLWRNAIKNNIRTTTNVCDVNGLILSRKRVNQTLQTMRQQYLKLCTAANIPESVNDVLQMKQRMIAVWSGVQQTVVGEAIDEQKGVSRLVNGYQFEDLFVTMCEVAHFLFIFYR